MKINFTKMQGAGNDYIYINCLESMPFDPSALSREMSPRHYSVGSDGVICICSSDVADARMRMFNLDGSEGKMCGNGIRCVGKYLYDYGIVDKTEITVETLSGIKRLTLNPGADGCIESVCVDMGIASVAPQDVPAAADAPVIDAPVDYAGCIQKVTAVSMGNPHAVIFTDEVKSLELEKIGTVYEHHPMFPEGVNTEFIRVISKNNLEMRVWERGSGETYACGTGACASAVAAVLNGFCDYEQDIRVKLVGGTLIIRVMRDMRVFMTGPATTVYEGVYNFCG